MYISNLVRILSVFTIMICISCVSASTGDNINQKEKTNSIDSILEKLNTRTQELESYQCQVEYRHVQPSVFEIQTLRKGILYYSKKDDKANLRVNFQTFKQDEENEKKYNEQYIIVDGSELPKNKTNFEGIWLVRIDYEYKSIQFKQITHAGDQSKSVNVFDVISEKFPLVGFTKSNKLKEQFNISLVDQKNSEPGDIIQVHLNVKPNSVYKDYAQVDFWMDEKLNLPVKIKAISTEPAGEPLDQKDFIELKFLNAKINEKIDKSVFDFQIPKGFDEPEVYPLKDDDN